MKKIILATAITLFILTPLAKAGGDENWQEVLNNLDTNEEVEVYKKPTEEPLSLKSLQANLETRRVPTGTRFRLRIESPVNSHNSNDGDSFRATLLEDIKTDGEMVLPANTVFRGTVDNIVKVRRFSRDAEFMLKFDHLVTPIGRQVPLTVRMAEAENITEKGAIRGGDGYAGATRKNLEESSKIISSFTQAGISFGQRFWNGTPVIITAPVAGIAGIATSSVKFVGQSIYDMFKKGNQIILSSGDLLSIILKDPIDVPVD